jgi:hypothetical protein
VVEHNAGTTEETVSTGAWVGSYRLLLSRELKDGTSGGQTMLTLSLKYAVFSPIRFPLVEKGYTSLSRACCGCERRCNERHGWCVGVRVPKSWTFSATSVLQEDSGL